MDEQEEYQVYEDAYYENNLAGNDAAVDEEEEKNAELGSENDEEGIVDVDHVVKLPKLECCKCHMSFSFSNKLHKHLCADCHYDKDRKSAVTLMLPKSKLSESKFSDVLEGSTTSETETPADFVKSTASEHTSLDDYEFRG